MERKTIDFRNSHRFSFLSRVIFKSWEKLLVNYDQIHKVRQRFYSTKILRVVRLIEIQIQKRALARIVCA